MKDFCPFLEEIDSRGDKRCSAGVNFASVGVDRILCRACQLVDIDDLPLCPNVDVYAFLRNSTVGSIVEVELVCLADALPMEAYCQDCPDHSRSRIHESILKDSPFLPRNE